MLIPSSYAPDIEKYFPSQIRDVHVARFMRALEEFLTKCKNLSDASICLARETRKFFYALKNDQGLRANDVDHHIQCILGTIDTAIARFQEFRNADLEEGIV